MIKKNIEGNEFDFDIYDHTLLIDPSSGIPYPFNVGLVRLDSRLIQYKMNYVISPRKSILASSKNQMFL